MIVHDEELNKLWLFDCDGVYIDISKTDTIIADGPGDHTDWAISQRYVTELKSTLEGSIKDVDDASKARDQGLAGSISQTTEALGRDINDVDNSAKAREQELVEDYTQKYSSLDNDIEILTDGVNQLTEITRQFIDITDTGLPIDPDPDVFYYTTEEVES